jgi:protein SCO1/2
MTGRRTQYSGLRIQERAISTRRLGRALLQCTFCLSLLVFFCPTASAQMGQKYGSSPLYGPRPELGTTDNGLPAALNNVGIDQKLNEQVPLDLVFRDETGREVRLAEYFNHGRPVIIALVYYECPMLCNQVLNGLTGSLKTLSFDIGKEFDVITVSFDRRETPQLAADKKASYIARYNRPGAETGWHFLTGDQNSIDALTKAVGFRYAYDSATKQFAHASGIMLTTPEGKLARYFYGIEYAPKEMRLSIVEASANKVGSPVDQLLLYCYHYDPASGKYGLAIMNVVRLGGVITVVGIFALLIILRRRNTISGAKSELNAGGNA